MLIGGIDEAGRGPVIGPMVIAGISIEKEKEGELTKLGVKDSKELTKEERENLFDKILNLVNDYKIKIIPPEKIDYYVFQKKLNILELETFIEIIKELKADIYYIDSPSKNTEKIKTYIKNKVNVEIIAENKADKKYPVVSAASIIAKVIRDNEIEKIKEKIGIDFGSGYPSDPKTQKAIKDHYEELKEYIRKSWRTVRSSKQKKLLEFL